MHLLMPHLQQHFDQMLLKLGVFAAQGVQVESWLKGELLATCAILEGIGVVEAFEREVKVPEGRIDMRIRLEGRWHWVELKQLARGGAGRDVLQLSWVFW